MQRVSNWIRSLTRIARIVSVNDENDFRFGFIKFRGNTNKTNVYTPYGMYHNPPVGSLTMSYSLSGNDSNIMSMAIGGKARYKSLDPSEVQFGNPVIGSYTLYDKDGNVSVNAPNNVTVNADGDVTIESAGTININADTSVAIRIGTMTMTATSGGIAITGGDVTADGVSLKSHVHTGVTPGASNTGGPA